MSPEFIVFLSFFSIWAFIGLVGMTFIGFYRWYYLYRSISLIDILWWGICVGTMAGPIVFGFIIMMWLISIKWDMTIVQRRHLSDENRYKVSERERRFL